MAPEPPTQKRKRGRPPNASRQHADASQARDSAPEGRNDGADAEERPRRRGTMTGQSDEAGAPPRRRRRPRKSTHEAAEEEPAERSPPEPSRRGRRRKAEQRVEDQDKPETVEEAPRRKRGRPSLQKRDEEDPTREQDEQQQQRPKKRRGRPPREEPPIEPKGAPQGDSQRRRTSRIAEPADQQPPDSLASMPPSPPRPYVHVAPHVRRVRQSAIAAKWSPLTGPSLSAASTLLHLAHRPILQRLSNTHQRRAHTSAALRLTTRRIARKVARGLPFPPAAMPAPAAARRQADGGRETELDFEAVLGGKALLEAQLGPAAHAVEVLRREKERVERELERDYEMLRGLEAGARAQAREQRGLLKKAHVLAPEAAEAAARHARGEKEVVFTHDEAASSAGVFTDIDDEELRPLAVQLGGHMESMRANLQQTDGILPQLARSRAALRAVLLQHLDQGQYERVVLG